MRPLIVGGHSLGAGRAADFTAIATLAGRPPAALINCGEPKPGYKQLADVIRHGGTLVYSLCNGDAVGHDEVTEVPFSLPGLPYVHTVSLTRVSASPADNDPWAIFRYHHCPLYLAGAQKLGPVAVGGGMNLVDVVTLINGIYAYPGTPTVQWDHYDDGTDSDGICWGLKRMPEADVVIFRGSVTPEDWLRDFDCVATPWGDSQLGPVHPGFLMGIRECWAEASALLPWPPQGDLQSAVA